MAFCCLCIALALVVAGNVKIAAQDCDPVHDNWEEQCNKIPANVYGSTVSTCMMEASEGDGVAAANQRGRVSPIICVHRTTTVKWGETGPHGSTFRIDFHGHTPFKNNVSIVSNRLFDPTSGVIDPDAIGDCYKYSVEYQISGHSPAIPADPKVIVGCRLFCPMRRGSPVKRMVLEPIDLSRIEPLS